MSSPYIVLARKWRSAQFSDVVGQTHVVRTLMNAIRSERVHQAYLFNGSRGIGKTSIARIFAKVLRCEHRKDQGDWLVSCDECSSCKEIATSTSVDVIEIDGASNNGVEAVREIRENAKYLPSHGSRKIYIIDEVHMLTTAAFNALLKTLEEPPAHVIFIFATTEPHKIPATILSRCQRFDFKRHTVGQIQPHLVEITRSENIQAEPAALAIIAKAAEGSMRDALSLLDQVIAFSGSTLTSQSVRDSIGLVGSQTLLGILRAVFARQALDAISLANDAYQAGHDLKVLSRGLIEFLHGAILIKAGAGRSQSLEFSEDEWSELQAIAELRPLEEMELIFQALHYGVETIARSPQPKIVLDVLLIKCALAEELVSTISGGGSASSSAPGPSGSQVKVAPARSAAVRAEGASAGGDPAARVVAPMKTAAAPTISSSSRVTVDSSIPSSSSSTSAVAGASAVFVQPPPANALSGSAEREEIAMGSAALASAQVAPQPLVAAAPAPQGPKSWENFIEFVRKTRPLLGTVLEHGNSLALPSDSDKALVIGFPADEAYYRDQLQSRVYHDQLGALARDYFGAGVFFRFDTSDGESLAARKGRESAQREVDIKKAAMNHPIILEARSLFGGELGPIELIEQRPPENESHV